MKTKVILLVALMAVLSISTPASCQQEEITLSTYYPAPYGEYDELCAEKLLVWSPISSELARMGLGDCHIGNSLIVGAGGAAGGGFSYEEIDGSLADGTVLIKGNVGIGTPGPLAPLSIKPTSNIPQLYLAQDNQPLDGYFIFGDSNGTDGGLKIQRRGEGGAGTVTDLVNIRYNGNVGIGTTNPGARLHVKGDIKLDENSDDKIDFGWGTEVWRRSSNGALVLDAQNDIIEMNGNVGIGTTSPQAKLEVAGQIKITGGSPGDGKVLTSDATGLASWQAISHVRAYVSTAQTIPANTWTRVNYNTKQIDILGEFSTSTYSFTASHPGIYLISASVQVYIPSDGTGRSKRFAVYKNGVIDRQVLNGGMGMEGVSTPITTTMYLNTNDYVELYVYCGAVFTLYADAVDVTKNWLSIVQIR